MAGYYCTSPLFVLVLLATVSNAIMMRHIYKASNPSYGAGFMFKFIGMSNVAFGIFVLMQAIFQQYSAPIPIVWFVSTGSVTSGFLQMGFNVSLALERLQVVKHPMEYYSMEAKKRLEKKLSLIFVTLSLMIGFSCSTLRFLFKNALIQLIPLATSRFIGYITLCVLYYKLYFAVKRQNQAIASSSDEPGQASNIGNEMVTNRQKQMEHAKKFFMGITTSFFVLNLPSIVIFFTTEEIPRCNTIKGIIFAISIGLSLFNMLFDTIWYFYMDRRSRRS